MARAPERFEYLPVKHRCGLGFMWLLVLYVFAAIGVVEAAAWLITKGTELCLS